MPASKTLTIRLPAPMRTEISRRAEAAGKPVGEITRTLLRSALDDEATARRQAQLLRHVLAELDLRIPAAIRAALDEEPRP